MKKIIYALLAASLCFAEGCAQVQELTGSAGTESAPAGTSAPSSADDAALVSAVKDALSKESSLANADITVTANRGEVALSGRVPDARTFNRAISAARTAAKRPVKAVDLVYP